MRNLPLLFILVGGCSPKTGITLTIQPNRVLYTSAAVYQKNADDSIARIKPGGPVFGKNLTFIRINGERKKVPRNEIWGYSDEKGRVWRSFKKTYCKVLRVDDIVEYEVTEPRTVGLNTVVNEPVKLYSKTLESTIFRSRKRAIRDQDELKME